MQVCDILEHSATDHEAACCMPSQSLLGPRNGVSYPVVVQILCSGLEGAARLRVDVEQAGGGPGP